MSKLISERLGVRYPVILGGMAWVGTASLVAAVGNAGGLGILGAGGWNSEELESQIRQTRGLCDRPFGVNIPVGASGAESLVETVVKERVPVVATSAGNPRRFTGKLKENGCFVIHIVSTVEYAVKAEKAGVDAVVAEGSESGGTTSLEEISTLVLLPQVVDAVKCPVIAAGGIGDGRGLAAALTMGASGVQIGTLFLSAEECEISRSFKELMVRARETDTMLARTEKSARRIFKADYFERFVAEASELSQELRLDERAASRGLGQVTGLICQIMPVKAIMEELVTGCNRALSEVKNLSIFEA